MDLNTLQKTPSNGLVTDLTPHEAAEMEGFICTHLQLAWFKLQEFHDRKGHLALGYTSFREWVERKLGTSEQRAYQLLDAAKIRTELDAQPGLSIDAMTERQARELKPLPPAQRVEVARQIDFAQTPVRELRQIVRQAKAAIRDQETIEHPAPEPTMAPAQLPPMVRLICGDFANVADQIAADSVDCIITDPPYPREFLHCYATLAREAARILKPGGSLLTMAGQSYLPDVMALLTPHLRYHWTLGYLTPGGQSPQIWPRKVNTFWKPVLWFVKGEYSGDWHGDVIRSDVNDNDKRFHEWGQSESGIGRLVESFTSEGDLVLDPYLGGGTVGAVCVRLRRAFVGVDVEQATLDTARQRIAQESG